MTAMSPAELLAAWENAYLDQCQAARVGKLFRGTIHNLNGIVQAFSMQSELFSMMFVKADRLLGEALDSAQDPNCRNKIMETRELLEKREKTLGQVEEKILLSQQILKNNEDISYASDKDSAVTLHSLINNVVAFFNSHMFFKHKVSKDISLDAEISLGDRAWQVSIALANLVENSIQAMEQNQDHAAYFAIRAYGQDGQTIVEVEDNGTGVPEQVHETLFEEFTSAAPSRQGVGLYLARKLVTELGGELKLTSPANPTIFTLTLPSDLQKA